MTDPETGRPVPPGVDVRRPSVARVYDYFLGGAHNFAVDRELAERVQAMTPNVGETMRANRAFLRRGVRFLVAAGIRQFLDVGSGIPTVGNVHEVARAADPEVRVTYVDLDPVAVAHSAAILGADRKVAVLRADLRDPDAILAEVRRRGTLDLAQPLAVLLAGVVHFIPDADHPADAVARLRAAMPAGSYLLLSHATLDGQPDEVRQAQALSTQTSTEITLRPRARIAEYVEGLQLVDPGLVFVNAWRPEPDEVDDHPERIGAYGVVGRKG